MKSVQLILKTGFILLFVGMLSCESSNDEPTQEEEALLLQEMFSEIENLAQSRVCIIEADWKITSYGSKACGGPIGYIAYHKEIDESYFLAKIEEHKTAQSNFNIKWEIISDCSLPATPVGVECQDGLAILVY